MVFISYGTTGAPGGATIAAPPPPPPGITGGTGAAGMQSCGQFPTDSPYSSSHTSLPHTYSARANAPVRLVTLADTIPVVEFTSVSSLVQLEPHTHITVQPEH